MSAQFLALGPRATVDQTLYRLAKSGEIIRVTRGMYARPKMTLLVGEVRPGPNAIIEAIARSTGETITVTPAQAERLMGLTTQMSMRPVFATSGRSRVIKIGDAEIILRHTCHRKLTLTSGPAGLALLALWNRGRHNVTAHEIGIVFNRLPSKEKAALTTFMSAVPSWLAAVVSQFQKTAPV